MCYRIRRYCTHFTLRKKEKLFQNKKPFSIRLPALTVSPALFRGSVRKGKSLLNTLPGDDDPTPVAVKTANPKKPRQLILLLSSRYFVPLVPYTQRA